MARHRFVELADIAQDEGPWGFREQRHQRVVGVAFVAQVVGDRLAEQGQPGRIGGFQGGEDVGRGTDAEGAAPACRRPAGEHGEIGAIGVEGQFLTGEVAALRRVAGVAQTEVAHFLEVLAIAVDRHGASQPLAECAEHPLEFVLGESAQQRGIVQQHAAAVLQFVMQALAQESLRAIRGTPLQQAREQRF